MKNLTLYNNNLSVPKKSDVDALNTEVQKKLTKPNGTKGQLLGFTENNIVGAVDAPLSAGSYFNKKFSGTLTTTWQGASAPFYQQFDILDMIDTVCPIVFPQIPVGATAEQTAWNTINGQVESFNGYVRFYTNTKTTTPVNFILYYGNPTNPTGGERVTLVNNATVPASERSGQFFEDVK